jgi:ATP-dependent Clp protease ATP-binding subunit ClpA
MEEATLVLERIRRLVETTGEGEVSLTPRSEKAVQLAVLEARQLGHDRADTEHLLLGLARETEVGAARILDDLGVTYEEGLRRVSEARSTAE